MWDQSDQTLQVSRISRETHAFQPIFCVSRRETLNLTLIKDSGVTSRSLVLLDLQKSFTYQNLQNFTSGTARQFLQWSVKHLSIFLNDFIVIYKFCYSNNPKLSITVGDNISPTQCLVSPRYNNIFKASDLLIFWWITDLNLPQAPKSGYKFSCRTNAGSSCSEYGIPFFGAWHSCYC